MKKSKIYLSIIIVIYIIVFFIISKNLDAPYLWFDEAGQFFVSKGLNHDSNPLEKDKGLAYVIKNNSFYNLDPGGFSVLLHYWSKISNYHVWLRILPFIFFILTLLAFIYLAYFWSNNINFSLLISFVPIISPFITNMGFELRAFSMECLGTIMGVIALERLKKRISKKELFCWGLIFSFFMTSRYSEIVIVFLVSLLVLYLIYKSKTSLKTKCLSFFIYISPILITLLCIYYFSLRIQNPNADPVSYLPYLKSDLGVLLKPLNIVYFLFLLLLSALIIAKKRFPSIKKYQLLLILTVSSNVLFIILSLLGKYPWAPISSKMISLIVLSLLCCCAVFGEIVTPIFNKIGRMGFFIVIFAVLLTLYIRKDKLSIRMFDSNNTFYCLSKIELKNFNSIYVDRWESPCIRYLFEYGSLKSKSEGVYPEKFTFAKGQKHNFYSNRLSKNDFYATQPKMNDLLGYDLLITPELFKQGANDKWKLYGGCSNLFVKK